MNLISPNLKRGPAVISLLITLLGISTKGIAQQFSITAGSINTCSGVLEDSGGPSGQYGNNENFTVVICPDTPGDAIFLTWNVWNLSPTGPNNNLDRIRIWDGDNTSATFLGEYNTPPNGNVAAATTFNPTGCLTIQFISNGSGTGDFAASITCFTPCDRPTAVATMSEPGPAMLCVGEEISFDGLGSYAAPTFNIVDYEWDFDDGTTASGATATHAFNEPGEYIVQLNLTDDNDCVNSNVVDLQILVSTTPSFIGTMESVETCLGATVDLSAVVTPVTWTGLPEANFGDGVYLPDSLGVAFNSDVAFTQFEPGQTLTNANDLESICVSMEHSFMGDLVISVTCPNGQSIVLHQQGGGGTYIGGANDNDNNQTATPGECWNYCWAPNAPNGTWANCAAFGPTPNVIQGGTPPNNALAPGTYSSVQPWTNLQGCPLNGTWTFTSVDLWGADNGFLCSWELNFNPAIIPPVTQFTPDLGTSTLDSAFWSGPFLTPDLTNPLVAQSLPTTDGTFNYTFYVTDNFGCTYDTTVSVTIAPQMEIDAGPSITLCNDSVPMAGTVVANGPPTNCVWTLVLDETFGDGWNGGATLAVNIGGTITNYTVPSGPNQLTFPLNVSTGTSISLNYTAGSSWNNENSFDLLDDLGATVYSSPQGPPTGVAWSGTISCGGGTSPTAWQWSPTTGLNDPTDPTTNVFVTQPTWYYLTAYPVGSPDCAVLDSVLVAPDPSIDAGGNNTLIICASESIFQLTDSLAGTPDAGGVWTTSAGAVVPNTFDPETGATDIYTYTVTSPNGCQATAELDITIIPADDPSCCGVATCGPPAYSCDLTIALEVDPGNTGVGQWSGPPGAVFADAFATVTTVTVQPGMGGSHWFYWIEDDGAFCYLIDSVQMTFTDSIIIDFDVTDATCFSWCDGEVTATITGGNAANDFLFDWSTGTHGFGIDGISALCMGDYELQITDDNGCIGLNTFTINEPILLEIDSLASQPVTCSGDCDGQVEVYDPEAIDYSYDDGATWGGTSTLTDACEGIYTVRIMNAAGCEGVGAIEVTGPPPVIADFGWNPIPANVDDPRIWFGNLTTGAQSYWWDIAGLTTSTEFEPYYRFSEHEPGEYLVCLAAFNSNQCADTICKIVTIEDVLFTYVPNSFTPDGDDLNETWGMSTNIDVITKFELRVFDRWGQVVFESENPREWWNGAANNSGEILKTDVYVYRIAYEIRQTEVKKELFGHVTLIK